MSMFTICTAFAPEGKLDETIKDIASSEKVFTSEIGVIERKFYQCIIQPHIMWANTEWVSEKHHNDAAQSLMKKRRDDRFASIMFGPDPYFEIFCDEDKNLRVGNNSDDLEIIVIAHGLINSKSRDKYLELRTKRITEMREKIPWLSIYHNIYAPDEFVSFLGFKSENDFNNVRNVGDFLLEEYLFTGLRQQMGMSYIAGYNQFICRPLLLPKV